MLHKFTGLMDKLIVYPKNMMKNLELTAASSSAQRVLLALTEGGLKREDAYKIVQDNAMAAWNARMNGVDGPDFKARLLADPRATKVLTPKAIAGAFDLKWYLRNVGVIFKRLKI